MSTKIIERQVDLHLPKGKSCFLWGPRKAGKSFWIRKHLKGVKLIDLLQTDVFAEYAARPALLRERYEKYGKMIVIDEVQKIPRLLDEVQWLIEERGAQFLLTGSSARKLRRGHANLLGGRAWRRVMLPLSFSEVTGFQLEKALFTGMLPPHFLSESPAEDLRSYVADYLKEEIAAEALTQSIPSFSDFLRVATLTSSEILNYTNIARECGVSQRTVRLYFDILEDTFLGFRIPPWTKSENRRMILAEKFYFFDVGVAGFLAGRHPVPGNSDFGKAFEHFILMELRAYQAYREPEMTIRYWRTAAKQEVDFILGEKEAAVEIKSGKVHEGDLRGLRALLEDGPVKKAVVVCTEREPRSIPGGIEILPWQEFLERLWSGKLL
ncbi:MAG TPA: ATP-binding protein [Candidatus Omnitrophota bacterium]|nr:ATP-binding protein [Candidatus Omnitrophota bacterium]